MKLSSRVNNLEWMLKRHLEVTMDNVIETVGLSRSFGAVKTMDDLKLVVP